MEPESILARIWEGDLKIQEADTFSPLSSILETLLVSEIISLTTEGSEPIALFESVELLPDITLGDVLFEEFCIDAPAGAVILIEPADTDPSEPLDQKELGKSLGALLIDLIASMNASDWSLGGLRAPSITETVCFGSKQNGNRPSSNKSSIPVYLDAVR